MKEKGKNTDKEVKEPKVKKKKPVEKSRGWEKERREKLNIGFNELCKLLPDHDPSVTLSKMEILTRAAVYIRHLQEQNDEIIKCGNKSSLRNEADRLKKRVAFLLIKTKELVNALRVAGVPIPCEKKRKRSSPKKPPNSEKEKPDETAKKVCVTSVKNLASSTMPVVANTGLVMTTSPVVRPLVATGLQPIGIDKKVLSRLGPGTLILADGRVVNVPPVVPQIVVKPQPTVLVMQRFKKGESLIAPKKREVTNTTFANKAPIPAIKAFRLESRPRSPKPKKKPKINKNEKNLPVVTTSVTTPTTTTTTSTTVLSSNTEKEIPPDKPENEEKTDDPERDKEEKSQNIKYTIDALFSTKGDNVDKPDTEQVSQEKEKENENITEPITLEIDCPNTNTIPTNVEPQITEVNTEKSQKNTKPESVPSSNFYTPIQQTVSVSQASLPIGDFNKKNLDKDPKVDTRKKDDKLFYNNVLNDDFTSNTRTQMFQNNQNYYNDNLTHSMITNPQTSTSKTDLFSHDITPTQNLLTYQSAQNEQMFHTTNSSLLKTSQFSQFNQNQNEVFPQNKNVPLYPQSFSLPSTSQENQSFPHKFIPISSNQNSDNFSINVTHRNQEPQMFNKFIPNSISQTQICDNFMSNITVPNSFSHKIHNSNIQTNCDNFSMSNIAHGSNTQNFTQKSSQNCENFINIPRSQENSTQTFPQKNIGQLNCENFSMSSITHRNNLQNQVFSQKTSTSQNMCNNFIRQKCQNEPNVMGFNQKIAPVNEKTGRDKNDKLYSTNTEGSSFKTDGCSHDLMRLSKEIERNPFIPIDDVRLSSDFSNDLFNSLQVPTGHSESISPTAAFLLAFPLVSTSKNVDNLNEAENHENQTSTPTTILQIGNIDTPNTEMFQPIEFGKGKEFDLNADYLDVQMKCKRKETGKKIKPVYQNYNYNQTEYNQYEQPWTENKKQPERKKPDKVQKCNYEYFKNEKKKKSKISVHWMTTPETEVYPRETETFTSSSQYNMEIDNIPDLYTPKKNTYSWSPSKSLMPLENSLMIPTSTLPTLVGDLALGTTTPSDVYKRYEKKTPEKTEEKRLQPKSQANFLSVSQLVDPKSKKMKPPERQFKKQDKKRNVSYPKRKDVQDPCMFNDNFVPNFNWDKRYKGNYSAESLIATQDMNETFNYQQNNYFQNTEFVHDPSGQSSQYQNCFNFSQNHFSSFVSDEYQTDNFAINNSGTRSIQVEKKTDPRYREEGVQNNFLQSYYPSACTTTSASTSQSNFNISSSMPSNFGITTNTTTSLTNFNLSTIFPEMNDQRSAPAVQGNHSHMNTFPNQSYRSHPPL